MHANKAVKDHIGNLWKVSHVAWPVDHKLSQYMAELTLCHLYLELYIPGKDACWGHRRRHLRIYRPTCSICTAERDDILPAEYNAQHGCPTPVQSHNITTNATEIIVLHKRHSEVKAGSCNYIYLLCQMAARHTVIQTVIYIAT